MLFSCIQRTGICLVKGSFGALRSIESEADHFQRSWGCCVLNFRREAEEETWKLHKFVYMRSDLETESNEEAQ
jgi:hypothetical protein